jgi:hypothetical protein
VLNGIEDMISRQDAGLLIDATPEELLLWHQSQNLFIVCTLVYLITMVTVTMVARTSSTLVCCVQALQFLTRESTAYIPTCVGSGRQGLGNKHMAFFHMVITLILTKHCFQHILFASFQFSSARGLFNIVATGKCNKAKADIMDTDSQL